MRRFLASAGLVLAVLLPLRGEEPAPVSHSEIWDKTGKDFVKDTGTLYGAWHSGVIGGGGYIQNVVPCPDNGKRYYSYVDVGGMYRSDDGGMTWKMVHGSLPPAPGCYEVRGLVVDPRDSKKVLAATGGQYGARQGIFRSEDGGETWTRTLEARYLGNGPGRASGFILARHPQNPDILVTASLGDGVWKSVDNGRTWTGSGGKDLYPLDIRFDRADPKRIWMCTGNLKLGQKEYKAGFYRSEDGGTTWQMLSESSPSEIIQDPVEAGSLYGIFKTEIIKRSLDGGKTWENFSEGLNIKIDGQNKPPISESGYGALAAGPDFILTANRSNSTFFKLKSGSSVWEPVKKEKVIVGDWYGSGKGNWFFGGALGSITVDPLDPNHWFLTDYFAIYQTRDAGKIWTLTINGIEVTVSHCLTQDPSDPAVIHVGQADIGSVTSLDGGKRFHKNSVPDDKGVPSGGKNMKCIDLSPKNPRQLYAVGDRSYLDGWTANQVFVSEDRGNIWRRSPMAGLPDMKGRSCTSIAADLNDANTVYLGVSGEIGKGGGVYKSTDGGKNWVSESVGLPENVAYFPNEIWAHGRQLAVSADGSLVAISTPGNLVYRFDPRTKLWSKTPLSPEGKVWSVVADRLKNGRYFMGVRDSGIFRSDDDGANWNKMYGKSVSYVAVDTAVPDRVAAGGATGVIFSKDGGETWAEMDPGLPHRVYNIPAFAGERLVVGSGGGGVFWIPMSAAGEKEITAQP